MAISMMMMYMYPDDTEDQNEIEHTSATIKAEEVTMEVKVFEPNETTVSIGNDYTNIEEEQINVVLLSNNSKSESMSYDVDDEIKGETTNTEPIEDTGEKVLEYKYGRRMSPAVNIDIPTGDDMRNYTGDVDTTEYKLIGTYTITGYTPKCVHCCGNNKGITASGVEAIAGYTVAASSNIPFGTTLYIEGYGYYVVEDRGAFCDQVIDIAAPSHDVCYELTNPEVKVYIVPHEEIN